MEVNRLHSDELIYEIRIRGIPLGRVVSDNRIILREALRRERLGEQPTFNTDSVNTESEIAICDGKLADLAEAIQTSGTGEGLTSYNRFYPRLVHIRSRLRRLNFEGSNTQFTSKYEGLIRLCEALLLAVQDLANEQNANNLVHVDSLIDHPLPAGVNASIIDQPNVLLPNVTQPRPSLESHIIRTQPISDIWESNLDPREFQASQPPHMSSPIRQQVEHSRMSQRIRNVNFRDDDTHYLDRTSNFRDCNRGQMAINKWNVHFEGHSGVSSFLERIEELRIARGLTRNHLFIAAVELFKGDALIWYRSVRPNLRDWDDLVGKLRNAFLPCDYENSLWEEIRSRTQGAEERVVIFIAAIENLFNRLPNKPSEISRILIIRRNLLPAIQTQLALENYYTIEELSRSARLIEDAKLVSARYRPPPTQTNQILEPDLAYHRPRVQRTHAIETEANLNTSQVSATTENPVQRSEVKCQGPTCYNCNQQGHIYTRCPQPLRIRCFKCQRPDVTSNNCPMCSGNAHGAR